ncbi:MAG: hypothetical protein LBI81_03315 [Puniceicoccales bacterium]|nr:hypothetical protein [Puniceicoccales bacterium]
MASKQLNAKDKRVEELEEKLSKFLVICKDLQSQLKDANAAKAELEEEKKKLQEELKKAQEEIAPLRKQVEENAEQLSKFSSSNKESLVVARKMEDELHRFQEKEKEERSYKIQLQQLNQRISAMESENNLLKLQLQQAHALHEENNDLRNENDTLRKLLKIDETCNISAMAEERKEDTMAWLKVYLAGVASGSIPVKTIYFYTKKDTARQEIRLPNGNTAAQYLTRDIIDHTLERAQNDPELAHRLLLCYAAQDLNASKAVNYVATTAAMRQRQQQPTPSKSLAVSYSIPQDKTRRVSGFENALAPTKDNEKLRNENKNLREEIKKKNQEFSRLQMEDKQKMQKENTNWVQKYNALEQKYKELEKKLGFSGARLVTTIHGNKPPIINKTPNASSKNFPTVSQENDDDKKDLSMLQLVNNDLRNQLLREQQKSQKLEQEKQELKGKISSTSRQQSSNKTTTSSFSNSKPSSSYVSPYSQSVIYKKNK